MTTKKQFLMMALLALIATAAFAQRVGDTVTVSGVSGNYTIETVNGDVLTLRKVVTQGDGPVNWVAVPDSTFGTTHINGVAWGNSTWVAVGDNGKIAYSSDGRSWTAIPPGTGAGQSRFLASAASGSINAVAFGNNTFVAGGNSGNTAYSTDNGRTWTAVSASSIFGTAGANSAINDIVYGGGRFVAVGQLGRTAYSTDGRSWTAGDSIDAFGRVTNTQDAILAVGFGNNRFIAGGSAGRMVYSSNGAAWTAVPTANNGGIGTQSINGIAYANNRWVAVARAGRIAYSSDGTSWTEVPAANAGGFRPAAPSAIFGVGFGNNRWVAVGESGKIAYSTDAATWTAVTNTGFPTTGNNRDILAVAYGNGRFVAVGQNGRMAYCDW